MATLQQAITTARSVINDTDSLAYRYSDLDLLLFANDALDAIATLRPELFYQTARITCVTGAVQRFSAPDSIGLKDIFQVENGGVVTQTDRSTINTTSPTWMAATPAPAVHWMPLLDDPNGFLVYPPAPSNQALIGLYVSVPPEYAASDAIALPASYLPIIADYIVAMAQSRDAEHVSSGRAQLFLTKFYQALGVAKQTSMGTD